MSESTLRETIRLILESSEYRLKRDLQKVTLRLIMSPDGHVPDTLTRIRVLPTVAVVGQKGTVEIHFVLTPLFYFLILNGDLKGTLEVYDVLPLFGHDIFSK